MKDEINLIKQIDWFDDHFYKVRYVNEAKVEVEDYFPSITTKLGALNKPFLTMWYGDLGTREAQQRRDDAADRGTRIHHAWYAYTTGGAVVYQPTRAPLYTREELDEIYTMHFNNVVVLHKQDEMYDIMKLQAFYQAIKPLEVSSEQTVCNIKYRDAGTMDNAFTIEAGKYMISGARPVEIEGGRYCFDLKTGKSVGKEAKMQTAAYMVAAESMGEPKYAGCIIGHTQAGTRSGIEGFSAIVIPRRDALKEYEDYRDIAKVWERNFGDKKPIIRQIPGMISLPKPEPEVVPDKEEAEPVNSPPTPLPEKSTPKSNPGKKNANTQ